MCSGDENGLDFFFRNFDKCFDFLYCFDFLLVTIFLELRIGMKKIIEKSIGIYVVFYPRLHLFIGFNRNLSKKKLGILAEIKTG